MKTLTLQVPDNAEEGDTLTFVVNGQELEVPVPYGSKPGDVLEIQVADNERDDDGDDLITKVDLGGGIILELNSEIPNDVAPEESADFDLDDDDCDGTHALPWAAGFEIARRLNEIDFDVHPKRVLELGSGLGLFGMAFAIKQLGKDGSLMLTDMPSAMPLLLYNLERNKDILPSKVRARSLTWREESEPPTEPPYDCIIGSDLLYNVKAIPSLVATVRRLLHPTKGTVILAARWRKPELEREFFRNSGLEWTLLSSSSCQLSWEEWGNPSVEASNLYFQQTMILIQDRPKALADITEEETRNLSILEFEAWEQAHIQLYVGKVPAV
ncbi:lysine N-methyltransferase [Fragilaria crotonensis]|nr:lysine N-methyltransferase [Fragilaria crotonensis]